MKKLGSIVLICLIVWGANMWWVGSSQVLGQVSLDELRPRSERLTDPDLLEFYENLYEIFYGTLFSSARHQANRVEAAVTKLLVAGGMTVSTGMTAVVLSGVPKDFQSDNWPLYISMRTPMSRESEYFDLSLDYGTPELNWKKSENRAGTLLATKLVTSLLMGGLPGVNAIVFFENRTNGTLTREAFAEIFRLTIAYLSHFESVWDERTPDAGILFLEYYPYYQRIVLTVKSIPEKELEGCSIQVDGVESAFETVYPFILVETALNDGNHVIRLTTSTDTYELNFTSNSPPVWIVGESNNFPEIHDNGMLVIRVGNIDTLGRTVTVNSVGVEINELGLSGSVDVSKVLGQYQQTVVNVYLTAVQGEKFVSYPADITVEYTLDGETKTHTWKTRVIMAQ